MYGVVAQISSFCFETKKFCVTTEFVVLALMVKFTSNHLDHSIFVAALVLPLCFLFLDATGYFYQVKLRGTMESIRRRFDARDGTGILTHQGTQVIAPERASSPAYERVFESVFNHSMWLYGFLIAADLVVWGVYVSGAIG